MRRFLALIGLLALPAGLAGAAVRSTLVTPYNVELDARGRVHVADGTLGQVLRWDGRARRFAVVARGLSEPAGLAIDRAGNVYVAEVAGGRVRRIAPSGRVTTLARLEGAASVTLHPSSRSLAVASIPTGVFSVELASGRVTPILRVGESGLEGPHGVAYDRRGNLWIGGPPDVLRMDAASGEVARFAVEAGNVVPRPSGGVYVLTGSPNGGRVELLSDDGTTRVVAGTGRLSRQRDGVAATRVGILPSDVAVLRDGSLLVTQAKPVPAIRRIGRNGVITTFAR